MVHSVSFNEHITRQMDLWSFNTGRVVYHSFSIKLPISTYKISVKIVLVRGKRSPVFTVDDCSKAGKESL